ncbi:MAG: fumarylacetoacetate hydrolase family protein [Agriterribacter sp.]
MKLITYNHNGQEQLAILEEGKLFDVHALDPRLPRTMNGFLENWDHHLSLLQAASRSGVQGKLPESMQWMAPVPYPGSFRDGYAFRRHVEAGRRSRGLAMIPEFDNFPVFYFSNHRAITGPGDIRCMPDHLEKLDYELEAAVVICREGRNINAQEADRYIGGLMILNDLSARKLQQEEMLLNLGPAKAKDFATAIGPWLVTTDELEPFVVAAKPGHTGKSWNLDMRCAVNGKQLSLGNLSDMDWTFAEIIARASYGVTLYPGDIIGSGTVGSGCLLELNGTAKLADPDYEERWLEPGDLIKMEIEGLGILSNRIIKEH